MKKTALNMDFLIDKYLKYLHFNKSASELTLKAYRRDLEQFFAPLESEKLEKNEVLKNKAENQDKKLISQELLFLVQDKMKMGLGRWKEWSPSTRNRKISSLQSFLKWLYQEGYIAEDLNRKISSSKVPFKLPHFLSLDEVMSLIQVLVRVQDKESLAKRDLALIFLLYGGGLRVSEACSVRWVHLDFSQKTLKIKGKGSQERLIVLPDKVLKHLNTLERKGDFIFGSKPLHQRRAYSIVRNWGVRAGIKKPISPHVLRHSYATHLLESGSDLRVIQDLLGHRSLSATQKYTQVRLAKLTKTLNQHHPVPSKVK